MAGEMDKRRDGWVDKVYEKEREENEQVKEEEDGEERGRRVEIAIGRRRAR